MAEIFIGLMLKAYEFLFKTRIKFFFTNNRSHGLVVKGAGEVVGSNPGADSYFIKERNKASQIRHTKRI